MRSVDFVIHSHFKRKQQSREMSLSSSSAFWCENDSRNSMSSQEIHDLKWVDHLRIILRFGIKFRVGKLYGPL
jgi:hypothetical protein